MPTEEIGQNKLLEGNPEMPAIEALEASAEKNKDGFLKEVDKAVRSYKDEADVLIDEMLEGE